VAARQAEPQVNPLTAAFQAFDAAVAAWFDAGVALGGRFEMVAI